MALAAVQAAVVVVRILVTVERAQLEILVRTVQ
jgi:hypothetical protein